MKRINSLAAATLITGALLSPLSYAGTTNTTKGSFTEPQVKQIQTIVHDYLLENPEILMDVSQELQKKQQSKMQKLEDDAQKIIPTIAKELFHDPKSPVAGNTQGDVTLVEFFDYQCPHCKDMTPIVHDLISKDANLRVVYKELPIFGKTSEYAAKAALASAKQGKYAEFNQALIDSSNPLTKKKVLAAAKDTGLDTDQLEKDIKGDDIAQELKNNVELAKKLGLMGTPAFVIGSTAHADSNKSISYLLPGVAPEEALENLITQVRNQKG